MPRPAVSELGKRPVAPLIIGAVVVALVIAAFAFYLARRPSQDDAARAASAEAKAYVRNLSLTNVTMTASENFMQQRVVEVRGEIGNNGPRALRTIEIYCLFFGVDGREIYRERVPIVHAAAPLKPNETRPFRLPFDNLPDGWNQAVPRMVIAQITFAG